jgi:sugar lactone lactonase YvrE
VAGEPRRGRARHRGTTLAYSKEPTGLGHDPATDTLFVSDDDKKRIFVVRRGPDGRFGTADDPVSSIDTGALGSTDTEDPEFDPSSGDLFFLDGAGTEVYRIDPANGTFGDGDDVVTHFDVGWLGPKDFEGLASDPSRGTLLVGASPRTLREARCSWGPGPRSRSSS